MDTLSPTASQQPAPAAITPLLRTVVLCDLVDSTALVERVGDVAAAQLMQAHDRLLLRLLIERQGQLIDKADGVLALFERPVQAVAFALAYQRGLRQLAQDLGQPLQARVGIHVGDVMTWTHTPAEVLAGAKPVEVEGLAKPVAARLMGLALPGQILLSGMAQNLAQRAQGELADSGLQPLWRLHGRYRFKGVPAPMLVHEVGELGIAPLRPPTSTAKAWRELPLWRKPPVLALELLLVVGLAVSGFWSLLKSPPAIAFNERDWVVVADFNNLTGETLYDEALDTALRVGLEQSRYVNVLADSQTRGVLAQMQRAGEAIGRDTGIEVAQRVGARALLVPTVARGRGDVRLILEVVDPGAGVTVATHEARAHGPEAVLGAMDKALIALRAELGESLASIEKSAMPLEQATTANLDALRAFSLGQQAMGIAKFEIAAEHFAQALKLDPQFALARVGLARVAMHARDYAQALDHVEIAESQADRLPAREAMYLAAHGAELRQDPGFQAKWKALADLYPDFHIAANNYARHAWRMNRFAEADEYAVRAGSVRSVTRAVSHYIRGILFLARERLEEAQAEFSQSRLLGFTLVRAEAASVAAVRRDFEAAMRMLDGEDSTESSFKAQHLNRELAFLIDKGDASGARRVAHALADHAAELSPVDAVSRRAATLTILARSEDAASASRVISEVAAEAKRLFTSAVADEREFLASALSYAAWCDLQTGEGRLWQDALSIVEPYAQRSPWRLQANLAAILRAEAALRRGDHETARRVMANWLTDESILLGWVVAGRAEAAAGNHALAIEHLKRIADRRGRVYAEGGGDEVLLAENVYWSNVANLHIAESLAALGRLDESKERIGRLLAAWPRASDEEEWGNRVRALLGKTGARS